MRKEWMTVVLSILLLLSLLCGCSREKVDGYVTDLGEKVIDATQNFMDDLEAKKAAQEEENEKQQEQAEAGQQGTAPVQTGVEVVGEAVIMTLDYEGMAQVHTFLYSEGELASGVVYTDCGDENRVDDARGYFENINAQEQIFEKIRTEGTSVTASYSIQGLSRYQGLSMEQLRDQLAEEYELNVT